MKKIDHKVSVFFESTRLISAFIYIFSLIGAAVAFCVLYLFGGVFFVLWSRNTATFSDLLAATPFWISIGLIPFFLYLIDRSSKGAVKE